MSKEIWDKIDKLDLSSVRTKFALKQGKLWKLRNKVEYVESEYKKFLYLVAIHPELNLVPWSEKLDEFWHEHILQTKKYAEDCEKVFGRFIHHNPASPEEKKSHKKNISQTEKVKKSAFLPSGTAPNYSHSSSCNSSPNTTELIALTVLASQNHNNDCGHTYNSESQSSPSCSSSSCSSGSSCSSSSCGSSGCSS